jgi:ribosomal protein L21
MKYAIIDIKRKQYKVEEGKQYLVDKLNTDKPEIKILLFSDGSKVLVGNPVLKNISIKFKILSEELKGEKIYIQKYKSKSRYRRKYGFRPRHTLLEVQKIA